MTKSRVTIIALAVCCIALLSAGTMAYFTVQDTARNIITTANLDMVLQEKTTHGSPEGTALDDLLDFEDIEGATPGDHVSKIVYVENKGSADFYTRVQVIQKIVGADGKELDPALIMLDINTTDWTLNGDWYYYNKPVLVGEKTVPLFTTVTFDTSMGNDYQDGTVTVEVVAQSVQYKHNAEDPLTAAGWPEVKGVTAE